MAVLTLEGVEDALARRLKERAAAEGVTESELHQRILEEALRPRYSKERMLEALEGLAWDDHEFRPERAEDTGREIET